ILSWKITIDGKAFHSGYPQNAINPIELSSHLLRYLDQRFHTDFGKHPQDEEYKYKVGSSFKPTRINTGYGSLNQIPKRCVIEGDIRLTPFHDPIKIQKAIGDYIREFDFANLEQTGPGRFILDTGE